VKLLGISYTTKQLKTSLFWAVANLARAWSVRVFILTEDLHVVELDNEIIALTGGLQSESFLVVNESHA